MQSGVITAFRYITATSSSCGGADGVPQAPVQCSTEGKSTAMSQTRLQNNHQEFVEKDENTTTASTGLLTQLIALDDLVTCSIGFYALPKTRTRCIVRNFCKVLEISGHGVPWFAVTGLLLLLYLSSGEEVWLAYGLNMLAVLVMDIIVVAPMKLIFKRPRPHFNIGSIPLSVSSIDSYAFPSGHASRCVALAAYFCYMPPFNPWTHLWYIWGLLVSLSRVALGRHHILDVGAGMLAGVFIFDVIRRSGVLLGV